jgi:3-hydroxyacyl-[acyl-carrier-protein] dehydratase
MEHESALVFTADHPAFAGHFPGAPIVPGVLLLDAAIHAAQQSGVAVSGVASAKFLHPVLPGEPLALSVAGGAQGRARFEVRGVTQAVATGQLLVEAPQ